jgi:hypothetical protein
MSSSTSLISDLSGTERKLYSYIINAMLFTEKTLSSRVFQTSDLCRTVNCNIEELQAILDRIFRDKTVQLREPSGMTCSIDCISGLSFNQDFTECLIDISSLTKIRTPQNAYRIDALIRDMLARY